MSTPDPPSPSTIKAHIRDGYNTIAARYLAWTLPTPSPRLTYIDKLFTYLSPSVPSSTLLELGCGAGIPVSVALASRCHRLLANDISSTQLRLAAEKLEAEGLRDKVQLIEGDMCSLKIDEYVPKDEGLDAVVAFYSLIHLTLGDQRDVLNRIHGWLRGGGYLVCNFGAKEDEGKVVEGWLGMTSFWSSYGVAGSLALVEECGFEVVESQVVADQEDKDVVAEFLWVVARKK